MKVKKKKSFKIFKKLSSMLTFSTLINLVRTMIENESNLFETGNGFGFVFCSFKKNIHFNISDENKKICIGNLND